MSKLYFEILDEKRFEILKRLSTFKEEKILIGGTALALQIGHRKSYDFDFALLKPIEKNILHDINKILKDFVVRVTVDTTNELTILVENEIKITFLYFPFPSIHDLVKSEYLYLYPISDLASNKVYSIGRRGEWKDYVDLYFILKNYEFEINNILKETKLRFKNDFDEKLFWEQIVYWNDMTDFKIEYLDKEISKEVIQEFFKKLVKKQFTPSN